MRKTNLPVRNGWTDFGRALDQIAVILNSTAWKELVCNKIHSYEFFLRGGGGGGAKCKEIVAKKKRLDDKENLIQNKLDSQLFRASGPKYYLQKDRG